MQINDHAHDLPNVNACLTPRCYIVHFREPVVLVVISVAGALLPGIVIGEPELGVVTSEHGAFFEGMLHRALVVRTGLLKHIVEYSEAPAGDSEILAIRGYDEIGIEGLLLP